MFNFIVAALRRLQTRLHVLGKSRFLSYGKDLHIGKGTRLWAPRKILIGRSVYIGKNVHIEANCQIGNFCLIANNVAIIGRHDHDFSEVGVPVRFSPWIGSQKSVSKFIDEQVVINDDVWIGFGSILLTGITVGRGSIISAGSVVSKDVPAYSIVAGVPARVIGSRFASTEDISVHERSLMHGVFKFSERGFDSCVIQPFK